MQDVIIVINVIIIIIKATILSLNDLQFVYKAYHYITLYHDVNDGYNTTRQHYLINTNTILHTCVLGFNVSVDMYTRPALPTDSVVRSVNFVSDFLFRSSVKSCFFLFIIM